MTCGNGPPDDGQRFGYEGHTPSQRAFLHTYDLSLWPFDSMQQAVLGTSFAPVVQIAMPAREYGELFWWGQDCDDPTAYQTTSWRIIVNGGIRGGDASGLVTALEARCGILDGTMCPWNLFIPPGGFVRLEAMSTTTATPTVRGRLKGWRRSASPEMA